MANQDNIKLILIILLLIVLIVSIATKAAHWSKITFKASAKDHYQEVYPGLEGLIAMDSILFVFACVGLFFHYKKPDEKASKILLILMAVALFIRFILSLLFLAGDSNYVRKTIEFCDNYNSRYFNVCDTDWFNTLKGAWIVEIISIILVNIFAVIIIYMMFKGLNQ